MSRPDVALVAPYPPRGARHAGTSGVASYTANLAHALAGEGAAVTVVAPEDPAEAGRGSGADGPVRVERRFRPGPAAVPAAARAAASTGAPVVHLQHELFLYGGPAAIPGLAPGLARVRRRAGTVVTMHQVVDPAAVDRDFTRTHRVRAPVALARAGLGGVQQTIRRLADAVVVHEQAFTGPVPGATVIPHGVQEEQPLPRPRAQAALGLSPDRLSVLCFGFVAPYKGLELACEAAERAGGAVELVVAGGEHPRLIASGDDYLGELRRRYAHTVRFTGFVPDADVAQWFSGADLALFCYPKPHASSGGLALALAYGTPFLVSPQLGDAMGAGGELVAPGRPERLAKRLTELAVDPDRHERLTEASRDLAAGRNWPAVARRHLELFREVAR